MSINTPSEDATLQMYEKFLDFIEEVIDTELSMDVRNKNYNLFKTYFESHPTLNVLLAGLQKKHNIL